MKVYCNSRLERLTNAFLKVLLMTFLLDLIYIAIQVPINQFDFIFTFLLVSQIVALIGAIFIGLPVALFLNQIKHNNSITSGLICGLIVFSFVLFYLYDGNYTRIKGLSIFTTYGICCGYAFMSGYNKEKRK